MHREAFIDWADRDPRCPTHHLPHDLGASDDPYPVLEPLRSAGPVVRVRLYDRFDVWWVTTHAAASAALEATELCSDQRHVHPSLAQHVSPMRLGLIDKDGPEHTRLRTAALSASSDGALPAFRRHAGALCAKLVGALPPQRTADLVPTLIGPLVDETIGRFLGLPQQVDAVLRAHADTLVRPMTDDAMRMEITEARRALRRHVHALPQLRPPCAGAAGSRGEARPDEWTDVLLQMYVAGRRSTADFLATLVLGVLAQDRWAEGCRTPLARRRLCDEYLRFDGPIVRGVAFRPDGHRPGEDLDQSGRHRDRLARPGQSRSHRLLPSHRARPGAHSQPTSPVRSRRSPLHWRTARVRPGRRPAHHPQPAVPRREYHRR